MSPLAQAQFAADTTSPGQARRFARAVLTAHDAAGDLIGDVEVVISELVSNAAHAGATTIDVRLILDNTAVRIEVADDAPGWPAMREPDHVATSGRGLLLVNGLASAWGADQMATRKVVWAVL